jgi:hypothetical protein
VGVCIPVAVVMLFMQRKAEKTGMLEKERSGRSWWQSIAYYFIQFDGAYHACHLRSRLTLMF